MKIVEAINAMISSRRLITSVIPRYAGNGNETFFIFDDKYKWSIIKSENDYAVFYYPGNQSLEELASMSDYDWQEFSEMVRYSSKDLGAKEVRDSFEELHRIVQERKFGIEDVLDDIISKADWNEP